MRLFEMPELPEKAGKAQLKYSSVSSPEREGKVITLPREPNGELYPLMPDWTQFIYRTSYNCWFGGTDENPFLVRMNDKALEALVKGGTELFYQSLVPEAISKLSEITGFPWIRQGDIFAVMLPYSWTELFQAYKVYTNVDLVWTDKDPLRHSIFDTRHILTEGHYTPRFKKVLGVEIQLIAEGVVKAPDHKQMRLAGPHVLGQTRHLADPSVAD